MLKPFVVISMILATIASTCSAAPKAAVAPHANSAAAASGPSKQLQAEVKHYNDLISQVKILSGQNNVSQETAMQISGEWVEKHGDVSDTHPYPPDIEAFNMSAHRKNRQLARTMRHAAKMHRHLAGEPTFGIFYTDGNPAIPSEDVPGDLLHTDASNLHFTIRRNQ